MRSCQAASYSSIREPMTQGLVARKPEVLGGVGCGAGHPVQRGLHGVELIDERAAGHPGLIEVTTAEEPGQAGK